MQHACLQSHQWTLRIQRLLPLRPSACLAVMAKRTDRRESKLERRERRAREKVEQKEPAYTVELDAGRNLPQMLDFHKVR